MVLAFGSGWKGDWAMKGGGVSLCCSYCPCVADGVFVLQLVFPEDVPGQFLLVFTLSSRFKAGSYLQERGGKMGRSLLFFIAF